MIFLTGGTGMLGRVVRRHIDDVVAPTREEFDVLDAMPAVSRCEVIMHCAAMTVVDDCERDTALCKQVNVEGTARIVDLARRWNARLVFVSTPMVFSGAGGNYREHDATHPINFYGKTKEEGERLVLQYPQGLVLRANPIGVRPPGSFPSFIQWFVEAAQNNRSFDLFSDVRVDPISTKTFAETLRYILSRFPENRILHLGSRDVATKAEIWHHIVQHFPRFSGTVTLKSVDQTVAGKIAPRPKEMWLNVDLIQEKYGITMPGWREEVDTVLHELHIV